MSRPRARWVTPWPALVLIGAAAFAFREPLLTDRTFYFRDVTAVLHPIRRLAADLVRAGEWPLWNPYLAGGQPLAAESIYNVFYPLSALCYLLPFDLGFKWWIVAHYPLVGIGMYLLLREWGVSRGAALFGGLGLMLSGPLLSQSNVVNFLAGFGWLPLTLLAFTRAVRGPVWPAAGWAAASLALQALGDPQMVYFTVLVLVLYGAVNVRRPVLASGSRAVGLVAVVGLLAALLAAVQLVPLVELYRASTRSVGLAGGETDFWRLHGLRLLELVLPRVLGDPTRGTFWADVGLPHSTSLPWLLSPYLGLSTLGFAVLAVVIARRRVTWCLLAVSLGSGLLAFGHATPAQDVARRLLPLLDAFRYPAKWWFLAAFGACGLAALGVDAATTALGARGRRRVAAAWVLLGLGFLAAAAAARFRPEILASLSPLLRAGEPGAVLAGLVRERVVAGSLLAAAQAVGAALAVGLAGAGATAPAAARGALVCLLFLDLVASGSLLAPVAPAALHDTPSPLLDALPADERSLRLLALTEVPAVGPEVLRPHSAEQYQLLVRMLQLDTAIRYRLFTFGGRTVFRLRDFDTLQEAFESRDRFGDLLRLWSVRHVISHRPLPGVALELRAEVPLDPFPPTSVFRLPGALPRAWVARRARRVPDRTALLAHMTGGRWDPREETLLEGPAGPEEPGDGAARVEVVRLAASEIELAVAGTGGWLVLAEAWYPGWHATVDGQPATVERANYAQRAVRVAPGAHRVRLAYRPWSVMLGALVTLATSGALLGVAGRARWRAPGAGARQPVPGPRPGA